MLLRDQDRSRWDRSAIDEAEALLRRAEAMGRPGTYQLQAAILVTHAGAPRWEDTPWDEIVPLYDALYRLEPTPVVALNRGLALAERDGPEAGSRRSTRSPIGWMATTCTTPLAGSCSAAAACWTRPGSPTVGPSS